MLLSDSFLLLAAKCNKFFKRIYLEIFFEKEKRILKERERKSERTRDRKVKKKC